MTSTPDQPDPDVVVNADDAQVNVNPDDDVTDDDLEDTEPDDVTDDDQDDDEDDDHRVRHIRHNDDDADQ